MNEDIFNYFMENNFIIIRDNRPKTCIINHMLCKNNLSSMCSICFETINADHLQYKLSCCHPFHKHCLEKYVSFDYSKCPTCNKQISLIKNHHQITYHI